MFNLFNNKQKKGRKIEEERLINLKKHIEELGVCPPNKAAFYFLVDFFNVVSEFQDAGKLIWVPNAERFNALIENVGRDEFGMNRTKMGEEVTLDNVYLGNIFGLFTLTAREWVYCESKYEGFSERYLKEDFPDPNDWEVIVKYQVMPFVNNSMKAILDEIEVLLAAC